MSETIKVRWLTDHEKTKVAPKTLSSQIYNEDGTLFKDSINQLIEPKADKDYVDACIAGIPVESDVFVIEYTDETTISHTFEQIIEAINTGKAVYASIMGTITASGIPEAIVASVMVAIIARALLKLRVITRR